MESDQREGEAQCCNCGKQWDCVYDPEIDGFTPEECPSCGEDTDIELN